VGVREQLLMADKGYVQVYTGDGKGKTTAALGLALRASGAGLKVFIAQFLKDQRSSELASLSRLSDLIHVECYGSGAFIRGEPSPRDISLARKGLGEARAAAASGSWDLVILDEANPAARLGLISVDELLELIEHSAGRCEIVITGRGADPRIVERADLVTEMREVKHYFARGVRARKGIEA
jgi:cob(I)alamin adenosyltransferase